MGLILKIYNPSGIKKWAFGNRECSKCVLIVTNLSVVLHGVFPTFVRFLPMVLAYLDVELDDDCC